MSKEQDLSKLRDLAYELSKVEECNRNLEWCKADIEKNKKTKAAGTNKAEEQMRADVNVKVYRARAGILTFIQVITTLLMLAVSAYSIYVFINIMKMMMFEAGGYIFFSVVHGAVCLALIILVDSFINRMK